MRKTKTRGRGNRKGSKRGRGRKNYSRRIFRGGVEECPICIDVGNGPRNCILSCGHKYHLGCIYQWLKMNNTCPKCRGEIHTDERNRILIQGNNSEIIRESLENMRQNNPQANSATTRYMEELLRNSVANFRRPIRPMN